MVDEVYKNWCDKLLDLGKGNKLINFKDRRLKSLKIMLPEMKIIFDLLSKGKSLSFYDVDEFVKKCDGEKIDEAFLINSLQDKLNNKLLGYKEETLRKVLLSLKKTAFTSISETGVNNLYMAFGFLRWKEKNKEEWYNAPLLLIPIEIKQESFSSPFTVKQYEEEVIVNPTLDYMLEREYGIKLPAFQDLEHEEETIEQYFERVKLVIGEWSIVNEVYIGIFSFLKMNMYMDLKDNEKIILKNNLVRRILDKETNEEKVVYNEEKEQLELMLHNVANADYSQMGAIAFAKKGQSFVLQGPPGTGKSQTITNLVAEFLYDNKKILFVSEKLAALNVVYNNLKKAGLADYCLQLHSNKTNKKEVVNELYRVLNSSKIAVSESGEDTLEELKEYKKQLDAYARVVHTKQEKIGKTPYEMMDIISKYKYISDVEYPIDDIENINAETLDNHLDKLNLFSKYENIFGKDYKESPWYGFNRKELSYKENIELKDIMNLIKEKTGKINTLLDEVLSNTGITITSFSDLKNKINLFNSIYNLSIYDENIFDVVMLNKIITGLKKYNEDVKRYEEAKNKLSEMFNDEIYSLDLETLFIKYQTKYSSIFRTFNKEYHHDTKLLNSYKKDSKHSLKYAGLLEYLKAGSTVKYFEKNIEDIKQKMLSLFNSFEGKDNVNLIDVEKQLEDLALYMNDSLSVLSSVSLEDFEKIKEKLKEVIEYYNRVNLEEDLVKIQAFYDKEIIDFETCDLTLLEEKLTICINNFDSINDWIQFYNILCELEYLKLDKFIEKAEKIGVDKKDLVHAYELTFYEQLMYSLIAKDPTLHQFSRLKHDELVEKFKECDTSRFELSKAEILSRLSKAKPDVSFIASGSPASVIMREANKKRKQKPVRKLLAEIPELVQTLKPCFLMSPLSVSTYLESNHCHFDVVIFDEASQIFPWDAIGSIYRANQLIVVGDSKQMPPSNFFKANMEDEDVEDSTLDFESILDVCASILNQKWLKWHYRSKTEDLIAFSNKQFYENSLVTFPNAKKESAGMGISFYHVENGLFDRKNDNNLEEAKKVVELVWQHFENTPDKSLGVVAFSVAQQELIEDLINEERMKDDKFAKYFDNELPEPFFVKNLETVQGDERDVIIFSIAYGKDKEGKFIHNFGPLNKKGGERRLNVAITRAKYAVKVVASIKSYDIDLRRSSAIGTQVLKDYLSYAENGGYSEDTHRVSQEALTHYFEKEVYDTLKEAGYDVEMNVGCSDYKIDIGVKGKNKKDYVLAIECDGDSYYGCETTRDRDRLREEALERLGWNFYRIWSVAWFANKQGEQKKLIDMVEFSMETSVKENKVEKKENFIVEEKIESKDLRSLFEEYKYYDFKRVVFRDFKKIVYELIELEGPICEELLIRRIMPFFGKKKVTEGVRWSFKFEMNRCPSALKIKDYYVMNKDKEIRLRIPKKGDTPRDIMMICDDELKAGLFVIIQNNNGINKDGLFTTILELLGFSRKTIHIKEKLERSLELLISEGKVKCDNDCCFII